MLCKRQEHRINELRNESQPKGDLNLWMTARHMGEGALVVRADDERKSHSNRLNGLRSQSLTPKTRTSCIGPCATT